VGLCYLKASKFTRAPSRDTASIGSYGCCLISGRNAFQDVVDEADRDMFLVYICPVIEDLAISVHAHQDKFVLSKVIPKIFRQITLTSILNVDQEERSQ